MDYRSDLRPGQERKFQPIVHIDDAVWRERLIALVLSAPPTTARLTIVTAPAGFGKTTMLAQLARHLGENGSKLAWMNCDATDMDPAIFSENLLAALALSTLAPQHKGAALVPNIAAHIAGISEPLAIFIDEYEAASNGPVDDIVDAIASAAPPNVRIVLASREAPAMPLTQMQLAGKIRVVDADFLRFRLDETQALLKELIPEKAIGQVAAYADGWPFALQLARLRAASGVRDDWIVDARVKMPRRQIFDYLAEEVFSTLDQETISFLTDVAILETLDGAAANAVRERDDSLAFIRKLSVLKPIVVVDESNWSARMHPLLRDYLIDSLDAMAPERRAQLHLRAALHLAGRHCVYEAVEHAVKAGRLDVAVRMIEEAGAILLLVSEGALRVRALLQQLPSATVHGNLRLRLLQLGQQVALGLSTGAEFGRVERLIVESEAGHGDRVRLDLELARSLDLIVASEQSLRFSPWTALANIKQVTRIHFAEDHRAQCICLAAEITLLHRYGPTDRCERRTHEIERIYKDTELANTKPWLWMYYARNAYARGELDNAEQIIRGALHQDANFINYRPQFLGQITTVLLGQIFFQRGALDKALEQFASIMPSESFNMFESHVGSFVQTALCEAALGNSARAIEMLGAARHHAFEENLPHLGVVAAAAQIELELMYGAPDNAAGIASTMKLDALWDDARAPLVLPWIEVEALARARFFLQIEQGDAAAALETGDTLSGLSGATGFRLAELTAQVMRARALRLLGREVGADQSLACAMALAQKCGVVQLFIGFGAEIMVQVRALGEHDSGPTGNWANHVIDAWESTFRARSSASNAFTPRELDVLCELAKEQTTKMIAKALMLSPETVKQHLKAIFAKLGVGKREEAVAEARRRALMP